MLMDALIKYVKAAEACDVLWLACELESTCHNLIVTLHFMTRNCEAHCKVLWKSQAPPAVLRPEIPLELA